MKSALQDAVANGHMDHLLTEEEELKELEDDADYTPTALAGATVEKVAQFSTTETVEMVYDDDFDVGGDGGGGSSKGGGGAGGGGASSVGGGSGGTKIPKGAIPGMS